MESYVFKFNITIKCRSHTRRDLLSVVSSIYDPLGFLSPFTQLLLQDRYRSKCGWNEEIPLAAVEKWTKWIKDLDEMQDFRVAWCVKPTGFRTLKQAELHHFWCQWTRIWHSELLENDWWYAHCTCVFHVGESQVAPLKQVTIPCLELTSAVLAVRVDIMHWSRSQKLNVLDW